MDYNVISKQLAKPPSILPKLFNVINYLAIQPSLKTNMQLNANLNLKDLNRVK